MKIIIVGDPKDNLERYFKLQKVAPGLNSSLNYRIIKKIEGKELRFQIWSLSTKIPNGFATQRRYKHVRQVYYRGVLGGIVVFDVCNPKSYQEVHSWIDETWKNTGKGKIPIVIAGVNINERKESSTFITDREAHKFAEKLSEKTRPEGFDVIYLPIDEQRGENIDLILEQLGKSYLHWIVLHRTKGTNTKDANTNTKRSK
ncbi:MAG: hypothetical protein ACXAEU_24415 [Candidatus Hodarchaeales archaeon]